MDRPERARLTGKIGSLTHKHGADAPEVAAARTAVKAFDAELALRQLVDSAPAPTSEQLDRLRSLLGTV